MARRPGEPLPLGHLTQGRRLGTEGALGAVVPSDQPQQPRACTRAQLCPPRPEEPYTRHRARGTDPPGLHDPPAKPRNAQVNHRGGTRAAQAKNHLER